MSDAMLSDRARFLMDLETMNDAGLEHLDATLSTQEAPESRVRRAFLALRRDNVAAAQEQLDKATVPGDDPFAAMARASLCVRQGRYEEALAFAAHALELPCTRGDATLVRAVALSNLGRYGELVETPDDPELEDNVRGSLLAIQAHALERAGESAKAREALLAARRFFPDLVGFSEQLSVLRAHARPGAPRCVPL